MFLSVLISDKKEIDISPAVVAILSLVVSLSDSVILSILGFQLIFVAMTCFFLPMKV